MMPFMLRRRMLMSQVEMCTVELTGKFLDNGSTGPNIWVALPDGQKIYSVGIYEVPAGSVITLGIKTGNAGGGSTPAKITVEGKIVASFTTALKTSTYEYTVTQNCLVKGAIANYHFPQITLTLA